MDLSDILEFAEDGAKSVEIFLHICIVPSRASLYVSVCVCVSRCVCVCVCVCACVERFLLVKEILQSYIQISEAAAVTPTRQWQSTLHRLVTYKHQKQSRGSASSDSLLTGRWVWTVTNSARPFVVLKAFMSANTNAWSLGRHLAYLAVLSHVAVADDGDDDDGRGSGGGGGGVCVSVCACVCVSVWERIQHAKEDPRMSQKRMS